MSFRDFLNRLTGRKAPAPDPLFVEVYQAPVLNAVEAQPLKRVLQAQTLYHTDSVS